MSRLMRYRPKGAPADDPRLGRYVPDDWTHVDRYPLRALGATVIKTPVAVAINWYSDFDKPVRKGGAWWIGLNPRQLGSIRGGHALTAVPFGMNEPMMWWLWHNQIAEGICVSETVVRIMALINRKRYQPRPVYDLAQSQYDPWAGESPAYEGTSMSAGFDVARLHGLVPVKAGEKHYVGKGQVTRPFVEKEGISAVRWLTSANELKPVLNLGGRDYVQLANSWGRGYPRRVRMPLETLNRMMAEDGELGVVTDR